MCLTAPARVVSVDADSCLIEAGGRLECVSTLFAAVDDLAPGDWVLISGGSVVRRLDPDRASAMHDALAVATTPEPPSFATEGDR